MVWSGDRRAEMSVLKEIRPGVGEIQLLSTLTNLGQGEADVLYGSEWSFYQIPEEFAVHAAGASLAEEGRACRSNRPRISGPSPCRPCPSRRRASTSSTRAFAFSRFGV